MSLIKKAIAEAIGTFTLVFISCGVAALTGGDVVPTALAFGLSLIAMAYSIGRISGCHINPAVSLGVYLKDLLKKTPKEEAFGLKDMFVYMGAQIVGGLIGGLAVFGFAKLGGVNLLGNACNMPLNYVASEGLSSVTAGGIIGALLVEVVLTFIFVYLILNVTDKKSSTGNMTGLLIGLTLTAVHLVGIKLDGTSVNPARSIATAICDAIFNHSTDSLAEVWIFIVGPLVGAVVAAVVFTLLHKEKEVGKIA